LVLTETAVKSDSPAAAAALARVLDNDRDQSPLPDTLAKLLSTDRTDFAALLRLLLARPRRLRDCYRLLYPARLLRALRYARSLRHVSVL